MCGIAGFAGPGDARTIEGMLTLLRHRGPDAVGFYCDPDLRVHLGHARLSVLDLATGKQPMGNEDGTIQIVFNGEIYNHRDLRGLLTGKGHVFRSHHSDTETLVHGYEEWGIEGLLERIEGMFAFAILDRKNARLVLARDRLGEKPLFYCCRDGFLGFASEIRPLLAHPQVPRDIDPLGLQKLWAHTFIPAPSTHLKHVRKLRPGHFAVFRIGDGLLDLRSYWRYAIDPEDFRRAESEEDLAEELRELFFASVRNRLEADVPMGIFLSGGIDSSAVLAAAVGAHTDLSAFSMAFDEPSFDESDFFNLAAGHFRADHHVGHCGLRDSLNELDELLKRLDEPIGDGSILPTFLLCRFAREKVTVALGGDGSDELFAGYDPFKALTPARLIQRFLPRSAARLIEMATRKLAPSERNMSLGFKLNRFSRALSHNAAYWNPVWLGAVSPSEIADIFHTPAEPEEIYAEALESWKTSRATSLVDRSSEFFVHFYLPDNILTKVDRASMLSSLEVRSPFLDGKLVDFARRLPGHFRFSRQSGKCLLKKALARDLPERILHRRKKGFGIPLAAWLKHHRPPAETLALSGTVRQTELAKMWESHRQGGLDHRHTLLCWLAVTSWLAGTEQFIPPAERSQ
jgi:asparagine synthase (glutamine-hydrolysing)